MAHPQAIEVLVRRVAREVRVRRAEHWSLRGAFWGGLAHRVATALEWADHPDRTPLVDALVADTVERVSALESRQIVRRAIPVEGRWLGVPLLAGLVLALAPAIRLPMGALVDFTPSTEPDLTQYRTPTYPM